jgi:hypothetical protein
MRDDLHRTVPLPRLWKPVMKYVSREADWKRVPAAMSRAIRLEVEAGLEPKWSTSFKETLMSAGSDMFGLDREARVFDNFERRNPTPLQRNVCEVARGLHARDGNVQGLYERAVAEVCRQAVASNIAHVEAQVREIHGPREAAQVREKLKELSRQCSFEPVAPKKRRAKKDSNSELLNESIDLRLP